MLLFRLFARTGIYLLGDGTPAWVYSGYRAAVWAGTTAYNFAAILTLVLCSVIAIYFWLRRDIGGRFLPLLAGAMVPWNLGLFFFSPGPAMSLAYLMVSAGIVVSAVAVSWPGATRAARLALVSLATSFLCVYYFAAVAPLRHAGWTFDDHGIDVFRSGEALAAIGILAAFVAWGRTRRLRLIIGPAVAAALLIGGHASVPERFPLIGTWAMGVTMHLPFLVYAVGAALLGLTVLKLLHSGRGLLGLGLALLFASHRMLPLTYFNLLIVCGFLLMAIALAPATSLAGEEEAVRRPGRASGR
ncbi:MAG: hypothetical protein CL878_09185 [Dehalococcoidia bacterium]|nr:hypothetical protein [Dehalococcoidia bacterium]